MLSPPASRAPRRRLRAGLLLAAAASFVACESPGAQRRDESEQRNLELFNELIGRGTMQPVEGFDEESYFERIAQAYADAPRAEVPVPTVVPDTGQGARPSPPVDGEGQDGTAANDPGDPAAAEDEGEGNDVAIVGPPTPPSSPPINPYLEFGPQIVWYPPREGETQRLIMKPYTFPAGMGSKIFDLMSTYGDFGIHASFKNGSPEGDIGLQPLDTVVLDLYEGWVSEYYANPRDTGVKAPGEVKLGDMLCVTGTAALLREVEHFINLFAAEVRQIEIEAKIVEVTTRDSLDLGVRGPSSGDPVLGLPNPGGFIKSIDFSFGNTVDATESLFELGAVFDGVTFNAVLEAVANFENVSIISRPKVAVREGVKAEIVNSTRIPYFEINSINASGNFTTNVKYQDVGVKMYVIPRVVGTDTVVLNIDIEASQQTGTAVTFTQGSGNEAQAIGVPEISSRNAKTIVRLEPGQAVILGGLISERTVDRESKIPLVGDIPVLGYLFRSTFRVKEQTNVLFFIRPRILEGSDLNSPFDQFE